MKPSRTNRVVEAPVDENIEYETVSYRRDKFKGAFCRFWVTTNQKRLTFYAKTNKNINLFVLKT